MDVSSSNCKVCNGIGFYEDATDIFDGEPLSVSCDYCDGRRFGMTNERKNITQPSDWWVAFEEAAKAEGLTLSAWLGESAKLNLHPKVVKKLTERPPANRPPKAKD